MMGVADKVHIPRVLTFLLSPGDSLGSLATKDVTSFSDSFEESTLIAISLNLIYWSIILFGFFSLRARSKNRTEPAKSAECLSP